MASGRALFDGERRLIATDPERSYPRGRRTDMAVVRDQRVDTRQSSSFRAPGGRVQQ